MPRREIICPCGHKMTAKNDEALFNVVRRHVDDEHPDLGYDDARVKKMIRDDAREA